MAAKNQNRIRQTDLGVVAYISGLASDRRRAESEILLELFDRATGLPARIWADSMVGYGRYHYRYASGREGEYFLTGFSPRKAALSIYIMPGFDRFPEQLARLGPHRHSVSCLYVRDLSKVDLSVLSGIVTEGVAIMKERYDWWPE